MKGIRSRKNILKILLEINLKTQTDKVKKIVHDQLILDSVQWMKSIQFYEQLKAEKFQAFRKYHLK